MAWAISSHAARAITPHTSSAPTASATATITGSLAKAAMVMVICTMTEQTSLVVRARSCAFMIADGRPRAACRTFSQATMLVKKLMAPLTAARLSPSGVASLWPRTAVSTASHADPHRAGHQAERDADADELLDLGRAEIETRQGPAMQPAEHNQGDDVNQRHQPAANAFCEVGERIGADAQREQHADAGEVEQRCLEQRSFAAELFGAEHAHLKPSRAIITASTPAVGKCT